MNNPITPDDITRLAERVEAFRIGDFYEERDAIAAELRTLSLQQGKAGGLAEGWRIDVTTARGMEPAYTIVSPDGRRYSPGPGGLAYEFLRALATPPAHSPAAGVTDEMVERVARAVWNIRRDEEDRCDMELEDLGRDHSVWAEARAAIAARAPQPKDAR